MKTKEEIEQMLIVFEQKKNTAINEYNFDRVLQYCAIQSTLMWVLSDNNDTP